MGRDCREGFCFKAVDVPFDFGDLLLQRILVLLGAAWCGAKQNR
jgi:hypothetical protein